MRSGRRWLVAVGALLALALAIGIQLARDARYPRAVQDAQAVLYVSSGPVLRRLVLEFDALASDLYWIRALQHYGGERLAEGRPRNYGLLQPLLDITTSLDPYFTIAYRFGAIFLSEQAPGGPGRPDHAIALLQKGIAAEPTKWQYYHDIAFVHYWHLRDFQGAASWFERAASQPEAPNWLGPLVPAMLNAGGDRETARMLWRRLLEADQEWLRRAAARRLRQVDAQDLIDQLQRVVKQIPPPAGERYSWEYLIRRRVLRGVPLDPAGTPLELDPSTGTVSLSALSELHPMPAEHLGVLAPK